jgi:hypothetical protein
MGSKRRRWLNQSTHSRVANATASAWRQGPRRRITSVLNRLMTVSARAAVAVTDAADRRLDAGGGQALGVADRDVLGGFKWSSQHSGWDGQ